MSLLIAGIIVLSLCVLGCSICFVCFVPCECCDRNSSKDLDTHISAQDMLDQHESEKLLSGTGREV